MLVLCELSALPLGRTCLFKVGQRTVIALNTHAGYRVYLNRCPHLFIPLNWGDNVNLDNEGKYLRCETHGALFTLEDGDCILGPCKGEALWALDVSIKNNQLWIDPSEIESN
jgi:nitrite reductase/ring-hydroxylating ferredoxin subunit